MLGELGEQVPLDRVVAVVADLGGGRTKWGSGFLLTSRLVLTAWHCTVGVPTSNPIPAAPSLRVLRHTPAAGWQSADTIRVTQSHRRDSTPGGYEWGLDVAVLELSDPPWGDPGWKCPAFARVDRASGELAECVAVGYPMYMLSSDLQRDTSEVRGSIRLGTAAVSNYLMLHDGGQGTGIRIPPHVSSKQTESNSPWGGLSGAAVFHRGRILGHVVQHLPHLGENTLTVVPAERIATAKPGSTARDRLAPLLGQPADVARWPVAHTVESGLWVEALQFRSLGTGDSPMTVEAVSDLRVFGVHPAAVDPLLMADLGYVPRDIDPDLDRGLASAGSGRLVLVVGDSAAGKSRCAAEALQRNAVLRKRLLLVPKHASGLAKLLSADIPLGETVLWLDDLDRHMSGGLSADLLQRVCDAHPSVLCVATIRRDRFAKLQDGLADPMWTLLNDKGMVIRIDLAAGLTAGEQAAVAARTSDPQLIDELRDGIGLGEWMIAGPELLMRLGTAGALEKALAHAVIAWARTGVNDPLSLADARLIWTDYLPRPEQARLRKADQTIVQREFQDAAQWLCTPILVRPPYTQSLAFESDAGLEAHDYVVDQTSRDPSRPKLSDRTWELAIAVAQKKADTADGGLEALSALATSAFSEDAFIPAATVLGVLHKIGYPMAGPGLAAFLFRHSLYEQAVETCDEVAQQIDADADQWGRLSKAQSLNVKAAALWKLGRRPLAITTADQLVQDFAHDSMPPIRRTVSEGLAQRAAALAETDQLDAGVASCQLAIDLFGDDTDPGTEHHVAEATLLMAGLQSQQAKFEDAWATYQQIVDRYGSSCDPDVRITVANGACNLGLALAAHPGHVKDAIAALLAVEAMFDDDPDPSVREQVAKATYTRGWILVHERRPEAALAVFDDVVEKYGTDTSRSIGEYVASALCDSGLALSEMGDFTAAKARFADLRSRFSDDPSSGIQQTLRRACAIEAAAPPTP